MERPPPRSLKLSLGMENASSTRRQGIHLALLSGLSLLCLLGVQRTAQVLASQLPPESPGVVSYVNFDVLVAIYTGPSSRAPQFTAQQVQDVRNYMASTRSFYWRNSRGAVNLTLSFLEIPETKVKADYDLVGLRPQVVAQDLLERGVANDQYDIVLGIAPGNGQFGRGRVLGLGSTLYSSATAVYGEFPLLHVLNHSLEMAANVSGLNYLESTRIFLASTVATTM